ncbi:MAG: DUF1996 domain-containing protein [Acidimicrobiales bacterium]
MRAATPHRAPTGSSTHHVRRAGAATALLAVAALVLAACSGGSSASSTTTTTTDPLQPAGVHPFAEKKPASAGSAIGQPSRYHGPQGRVGQFVVHCRFSHEGTNDPIVHPNMPGMSHLHQFYGPPSTNARSTPEELVRSKETTCDKPADTAAYWQPALLDHGKEVQALDMSAYYRAAPGVDPKEVVPFPFGMAMLAGDQFASKPQPGEAAGWACGVDTYLSDVPPTCGNGEPLHLVLTFPDCWDGKWADSEDHVSHVAYSKDGTCPKGFPKHVPQLTMSIRFPISGPGHDLSLASGNIYSAHGDFFNAWEPKGLAREVEHCINRNAVCDLASNRQENPLFSYEPLVP